MAPFRAYFSINRYFDFHQEQDKEEAKRLEDLKELASEQKSVLSVLYNERERPDFDEKVMLFFMDNRFKK